jgi:hypothetical protein
MPRHAYTTVSAPVQAVPMPRRGFSVCNRPETRIGLKFRIIDA